MHACFQDLFVNPSDKTKLVYEGRFDNEKWTDGVLKSSDREWKVDNGIPLFENDSVGDRFTQEQIDNWLKSGIYHRNWAVELNDNRAELCREAAEINKPVLDIASGPGLGLLPGIIAINPNISAMASDANTFVLKGWQRFFEDNNLSPNISFAEFDATNMPLKPESIDLMTSAIGLSSIRYEDNNQDRMSGVNEAFRVLKPGGHVFAIEGGMERDSLRELYKRWGRDFDNAFGDAYEMTWAERFVKAGFVIEDERPYVRRTIRPSDNDIGEAASKLGVEVWVEFKTYRLLKP